MVRPSRLVSPSAKVFDQVDIFERALRERRDTTDPRDYFPPPNDPEHDLIVSEILRVYVEYCWNQGRTDIFERLHESCSTMLESPFILSAVAFEDYRLRRTHGLPANRLTYQRNFRVDTSQWHQWLEQCHDDSQYIDDLSNGSVRDTRREAVGATQEDPSGRRLPANSFPTIGTRLESYEILSELGRGAFSRVYLAKQTTLADRVVVLKVSTLPLGESQRLAQLQHGRIMPLYSAHCIAGLFVLCMPYLGSLTLGDLLRNPQVLQHLQTHGRSRTLSPSPTQQARGQASESVDVANAELHTFADLLFDSYAATPDRLRILNCQNAAVAAEDSIRAIRPTFGALDYEAAILQIFGWLAEALNFAHRMKIQHQDVKPSNILLKFDGQPLLMDFNLSRDSHPESTSGRRIVGGTIPYMAPEQLEAMISGQLELSPQADLYSLGICLYQMLTGRLPFDFSDHILDDSSDEVVQALASRRREPCLPSTLNRRVSLATSAIVMKCLAYDRSRRYRSAAELHEDLRRQMEDRPLRYAANPSVIERLQKRLRRHSRLFSLGSLSAMATMLLIATMIVGFQWNRSRQVLNASRAYERFIELGHEAEARLLFGQGRDRTAAISMAEEALGQFAPRSDPAKVSSSFRFLTQPQRLQVEEMDACLRLLIESSDPKAAPQQLASHNQDGALIIATRRYLDRDFEGAVATLDQELTTSPQRFALWFLKGQCLLELREFSRASQCFAMATARYPDSPTAHVARAVCCFWLNQLDDALHFLDEAERLAVSDPIVFYNRALVFERLQQTERGLAQINFAIQLEPEATQFRMARVRLLRALGRNDEVMRELAIVKASPPTTPQDWILRGLAHLPDEPQRAIDDFRQALSTRSTRSTAAQNMAHVYSELLGRPDRAIEILTELLDDEPDFVPAISGRGVLHARQGNRELALRDASRCLELQMTAQLHYQVACIYAVLSEKDETLANEAIFHLSHAMMPAYGRQIIATDRDLNAIRDEPEFQRIMQSIETMNRRLDAAVRSK